MNLHFTTNSNTQTFMPHETAKSIPLSSNKLPEIFNQFSMKSGSVEADIIKGTIQECENPAIRGEEKYCATSLESMIDFSTSKLGFTFLPRLPPHKEQKLASKSRGLLTWALVQMGQAGDCVVALRVLNGSQAQNMQRNINQEKTNDESRDLEMDCVRGKWLIEKLKKAKGESCARDFMAVRKQRDNAT
ncbi:hypothetical protein ACFX2H_022473 [Malus domestica]